MKAKPVTSALLNILELIGGRCPLRYYSRRGIPHNSLQMVEAFVSGFWCAQEYKHDPDLFSCFTNWLADRYYVSSGAMKWSTLIREKVGGDDALAFAEFSRLLPEFIHDVKEIGPEEIEARGNKNRDAILKELKRRRRKRPC